MIHSKQGGHAMKKTKTCLSTKDRRRVIEVLRQLHKNGRTLADCADPRRLRIDPRTLIELAREAAVAFPDEKEFAKRADDRGAP
jgi:hypothetical protein